MRSWLMRSKEVRSFRRHSVWMSWQRGGTRAAAYRRNARGPRDRQAFERIRLDAGELFAAGRSQAEVAHQLGVSRQTSAAGTPAGAPAGRTRWPRREPKRWPGAPGGAPRGLRDRAGRAARHGRPHLRSSRRAPAVPHHPRRTGRNCLRRHLQQWRRALPLTATARAWGLRLNQRSKSNGPDASSSASRGAFLTRSSSEPLYSTASTLPVRRTTDWQGCPADLRPSLRPSHADAVCVRPFDPGRVQVGNPYQAPHLTRRGGVR
jgi:hypothetical protein